MTAAADCRPPPGTPDGTVCVLTWGGISTVCAVWRVGAWEWPFTSEAGQNRYTPEELAANGWRITDQPREAPDV